ncbi:MAG: hypothetical protein MRK01_06670 [Candidatus Scalindua sp.]|nr:hypothetical protein [Candidatus Scalindua sp.]
MSHNDTQLAFLEDRGLLILLMDRKFKLNQQHYLQKEWPWKFVMARKLPSSYFMLDLPSLSQGKSARMFTCLDAARRVGLVIGLLV